MHKCDPFNQESNLDETMTSFWQHGFFGSFDGIGGVSIHYARFVQEQADFPTIVIVPGRGESYLKYQELTLDLYHQGYNIFIIDHRGQGLSERLLANSHKGYVAKFQDYVDDLQYFIENIVTEQCSAQPYLLAHSMGAAIATRFMQDSPSAIKAAVLSSPMLGFDSGLLPKTLAKTLITIKLTFNNIISNIPWYFWGQRNYCPLTFTDNRLTHSAQRYHHFVDIYKNNQRIQLGGVTSHWLAESIAAQKEIFAKISQLKTPILVLQAGSDNVVCQQAQNDFCQQLNALQRQSCPNGVANIIDGAFHELFFELDRYRDPAISQSLAWFKQHH